MLRCFFYDENIVQRIRCTVYSSQDKFKNIGTIVIQQCSKLLSKNFRTPMCRRERHTGRKTTLNFKNFLQTYFWTDNSVISYRRACFSVGYSKKQNQFIISTAILGPFMSQRTFFSAKCCARYWLTIKKRKWFQLYFLNSYRYRKTI